MNLVLLFSPDVKGKITAITIKLPDTNPNLRVTIWDYTTKTVLRTETLNVTATNTLITKEISELALEKDKKYLITMNSNDWYKRAKADNSNTAYPSLQEILKCWNTDGEAEPLRRFR
jgi:hypothetical protein